MIRAPQPSRAISDAEAVWTARDPVTCAFLDALRAAAGRDTPVILHGEPGSGRRSAARLLRQWRKELKSAGRLVADGDAGPVPTLRVPSLRERPQDLLEIAERCLATLPRNNGGPARGLTARALDALRAREWRGNINELQCVLAAAAQRAGARRLIDAGDLPQGCEPLLHPSQVAKDVAQRDCLLRQLRVARSVSGAAKLEGCNRSNYIRLMHRLGILRAD